MSDNSSTKSLPPFPLDYRASGVLLHVTSLPSPYGIGDVGPAALAELGAHHQAGLAAADDQGFDFLDGHGAVLFRVGKTDARVARGDKLVRAARLFIEKRPDRLQPALATTRPSRSFPAASPPLECRRSLKVVVAGCLHSSRSHVARRGASSGWSETATIP